MIKKINDFIFNKHPDFSELIADLIKIFSKEFYLPINFEKSENKNADEKYKEKLIKLLDLYIARIKKSSVFSFLSYEVNYIVTKLKIAINENDNQNFIDLLDYLYNIINLDSYSIFQKEDSKLIPGYRVRQGKYYKCEELFHRPYSKKADTKTSAGCKFTSRFSSREALFFSDDVKTAINETNLLKGNKIIDDISIVKINYLKNTGVNVRYFDFGLNPRLFIEYPNKIGEYHSTSPAFYIWYILWFPIILACSFVNDDCPDVVYKYSNLFYDWAIKNYNYYDNENKVNEIIMIRYISCKPNNKNLFANNYGIYTKQDNDEKYSELIKKCYSLNKPKVYKKGTLVQKIEVDI